MSLNYVTLVLDAYDAQGNLVTKGTAAFVPSAQLTDPGVEWITEAPIPGVFRAGSVPSVKLLATDNSAPVPNGWGWTVTFSGVPGDPAGFSFFLPYTGGATQYLSELVPVSDVTAMQGVRDLVIRSVTSGTTLASTDGLLLIDATSGDLAVGLPAPASVTGRPFYLKRTDTSGNYVTVTPFASELIDGGFHGYVSNSGAAIILVSDGTNWQVL